MPVTPRKRSSARSSPYSRRASKSRRNLLSAFSMSARSPRNFRLNRQLSSNTPFPPTMRCKLRYTECVGVALGSNNTALHSLYFANGLYDPRVATGGGQPYGFDQYAAMYDQYYVESSVVTCEFCPITVTTGGTSNAIVGITLQDDTSTSNDVPTVLSQDMTVYAINDTNKVKLKLKYNSKKMFAGKQVDALQSACSTSPSEGAYFDIWAVNAFAGVAGNNPDDFQVLVTIVYNVVFSERKRFGAS